MDSKDLVIDYDRLSEEQQSVYDCIGAEAYIKLIIMMNGSDLYIPSINALTRESRNKKIKSEFNGYNYKELARKYRLTTRTIRDIVKK